MSDSLFYNISIQNGKIKNIKAQQSYDFDETATSIESKLFINEINSLNRKGHKVDVCGRVVLPAFVDSHMHLDKAFSLAFAPNQSGTLIEAIQSYHSAMPFLSFENMKQRMFRTVLQALSFGTTTIRTHIDFDTKADKEVVFRGFQAALEVKEKLRNFIDIQIFPMCPFYELENSDLEMLDEAMLMGADGIGGAPHLASEPHKNIENIFKLAMKHNKVIDLHTDESDNPNVKTIKTIIEQLEKNDFNNRVVVDHLCSLSAMEDREAHEIINNLVKSEISVITLPASNMYLQGRSDRGLVRRGITRIRELYNSGVPIALASDNINDPFHPFGRCDLVLMGLLTSYAAHFGSPQDLKKLLKMMTSIPASIVGLDSYGLEEGKAANLVIIDAYSIDEIFSKIPDRRWLYKNDHWTVRTDGNPIFQQKYLNEIWDENANSINRTR